MKTEASLLTQSLLVLGVFGITALTTYGAVTNGWMLNATPYQLRSATADANLSRLTDGKGGPALDTVIAKIKATAELKWGTPVNVTTYNAYIDNRLAAIDEMDNQVRSEFGSDYTFLFQYFYPRVAELKKTEDKTANLLSKISSVFGGDTTVSTAGASTTVNNSAAANSIANSTVSTAGNTASTTVNAGTSTTTTATVKDCTFSLKPYFDLGLKTTFYYGANNKMYQPSATGQMTLPGDMKNQFNVTKAGSIDIAYGFQCQDGVLTVTDQNYSITQALAGTNAQAVGVTTVAANSTVAANIATDARKFFIEGVADGESKVKLSFKIDKELGYKGCILTIGNQKDFFSKTTSGYMSTSGQQSGLWSYLVDGTFAGSFYIGNKNLSESYVNLYCTKELKDGGVDLSKSQKVIAVTTVASILSNAVTVISTSDIPGNTVSATSTATSARKTLTADEKKVVKDYITAVIGGAGTEKEKAQKIYDAMIAQGLDAQHIADSISGTLADVNAYLAKKDSTTTSTSSTVSTQAAAVVSASDSVSFSANKTSVNRGETVNFTYAVAGDPVGCKAWYSTVSENGGAEVTFREGNSVSNTMSAAMAKAGTFSITFDKDASGKSGVFKDNKSTVLLTCYGTFGGVYQTIKKPIDITVVGGATIPAAVTSQATSVTTATSARRVLTTDEKKVVKDYVTAVITGAGTEKEKAQTIYNAMIAQGLDAQHIADSISGTLADVNAYLAKR